MKLLALLFLVPLTLAQTPDNLEGGPIDITIAPANGEWAGCTVGMGTKEVPRVKYTAGTRVLSTCKESRGTNWWYKTKDDCWVYQDDVEPFMAIPGSPPVCSMGGGGGGGGCKV